MWLQAVYFLVNLCVVVSLRLHVAKANCDQTAKPQLKVFCFFGFLHSSGLFTFGEGLQILLEGMFINIEWGSCGCLTSHTCDKPCRISQFVLKEPFKGLPLESAKLHYKLAKKGSAITQISPKSKNFWPNCSFYSIWLFWCICNRSSTKQISLIGTSKFQCFVVVSTDQTNKLWFQTLLWWENHCYSQIKDCIGI